MRDSPHASPTNLDVMLAYGNQWTWMQRIGRIDTHGAKRPIHQPHNLLAARTGGTGAIMLPVPPQEFDEVALDDALDWLRCTHSENVLIWSAVPTLEADAWLLAHGAQEHFIPQWMTRRASRGIPPARLSPATIRNARPDDLPSLLAARELPYSSAWEARSTVQLATRAAPDEVKMLVAAIGGHIVGRTLVNIAEVDGVRTAGLYDVGVLPEWQKQGIGRHMMSRAIELASTRGAEIITLNSTPAGEPLYRSLGFEDVGEGQSWLLPTQMLRYPPAPDHAEFALRIAWGDSLTGYERFAYQLLPNRETPLAMAARFEHGDTAEELLAIGTVPDIAALWLLGLNDAAIAMMERQPDAIDARYGTRQVAPLHAAIYWGDLDFLKILLDHGADPAVRDGQFQSDAWGWCHALGNEEALTLLEERAASAPPSHPPYSGQHHR